MTQIEALWTRAAGERADTVLAVRLIVTPWISSLALGLLTACPSEPFETDVVCKTIGPAGDAVTSADSVLTIGIRPGAVSEPFDLCIRPAAKRRELEVYGPAYRVTENIDLAIPAALSYLHPLRGDPDEFSIGAVLLEEYLAGNAVWRPLPTTRVDVVNGIVTANDERISMYYGLLDDVRGSTTVAATSEPDSESTGDDDPTTAESTGDAGDETTTGSPTDPTDPTDPTNPTAPETDSDDESDTAAFDCSNLPAPPYNVEDLGVVFPGGLTEDIAMTGNGTIVGESGNAIIEVDASGATVRTLHMPLVAQVLGITFDDQDRLILARREFMDAEVVRVVGGTEQVIVGGLQFPNGLYYDGNGRLWVTEFGANTIVRIDPNGTATDVLVGAAQFTLSPNGIFFDEVRGRLYWSNYGNASVSSAAVDANGNVTAPGLVFEVGITGADPMARWDGITMDGCGNLYVVDQRNGMACGLHRIGLDAAGAYVPDSYTLIAGDGDLGNGCANPEFGVGFGDDNDLALFVSNENNNHLYRIDVGVGAR